MKWGRVCSAAGCDHRTVVVDFAESTPVCNCAIPTASASASPATAAYELTKSEKPLEPTEKHYSGNAKYSTA